MINEPEKLARTSSTVIDEANFIWGIANKLRGAFMPDKYGDVIIPMTIVRRFECSLEKTKDEVIKAHKDNQNLPAQFFYRLTGYQFYNTSQYSLVELCNDPNNIEANFKEYIGGFSKNVQEILDGLKLSDHIKTMQKEGCLYSVVKAFSERDLHPTTYDSIQMGYIFENLIGRFFENVDAGQFYTGRDIIKMLVEVLMSEGCEDLLDPQKVVTVCDQACGTGGMLSTAYDSIKAINPTANVRLFGQEYNSVSWSIGLAEMLIKGQNAENFRHADTFKEDCFQNTKMRLVIENPPFGTPWSGKDAKQGQEDAVREEYARPNGRWSAGLPSGGDSQLLFMQSAIDKMDDKLGRAAIIQNGSPLFTGNTMSGESQIRRYMLEHDLIEAIIALPTDLFYNTGIQTYAWILSKNKRQERKGKIQLIDASSIFHKLRKPLGMKKNEFKKSDIAKVVSLYCGFDKSDEESSRVYKNTEFIYREYTVMQPLQRSYAFNVERIENLLSNNTLSSLYDEAKVLALEEEEEKLNSKDKKKLETYRASKPTYDAILEALRTVTDHKKYKNKSDFLPALEDLLDCITNDKKLIDKIADGLSLIDKEADIETNKKGEVIYDKTTKDSEIVKFDEDVEEYMKREVWPHVPDAKYFDEDKIGAEIPFTRYFYKYEAPKPSEELEKEFIELEKFVNKRVSKLFKEA